MTDVLSLGDVIVRLLLAFMLLLAAAPAAARPPRVMSLDQCSDLLLLMLAPRERIASVTWLAHDAADAVLPGADRGIPFNHAAAEEVLRMAPDVILAGAWSAPAARRLAARTGVRVVSPPDAAGFAQIRANVRQVAALVDAPARGEALIAHMDATLRKLSHMPVAPRRVVAWDGDGSVPGRGTLADAIIRAAGAVNIAASSGGPGSFDAEQLLAARPDAILFGEDRWAARSRHASGAGARLAARLWRGRRIGYPASLWGCGVPQAADAALALRTALDRMPAPGARW